jgi:hypothetical protein
MRPVLIVLVAYFISVHAMADWREPSQPRDLSKRKCPFDPRVPDVTYPPYRYHSPPLGLLADPPRLTRSGEMLRTDMLLDRLLSIRRLKKNDVNDK